MDMQMKRSMTHITRHFVINTGNLTMNLMYETTKAYKH